VYYHLYKWEVFTQRFFSYPFMLLLRNEKVRKIYKQKGVIDPEGEVRNATNNPQSGVNSIISGVHMGGLLVMLQFSIFIQILHGNYLVQYFFEYGVLSMLYIFLFLVPPGLFNHFVLFRKDRYLLYFRKFDSLSKRESRIYGWVCFMIISFIYILTILSFYSLTVSI